MSGPASSSPAPYLASLLEEVRARLTLAEAVERSGDPARLTEGLAACAEALARLNETPADDFDADRLGAAVWLKRGHLLERRASEARRLEDVIEALRGYDIALRLLAPHASRDHAVAAVRAGAWLNRGNALQRLGTEAARAEAVRSYEHAIIELADLVEEHPELRGNLAAAWTNLGLARQAAGEADAAVAAHERALMFFSDCMASAPVVAARETVRFNLALARRDAGEAAAALELLRTALAGLDGHEQNSDAAALAGLRVRVEVVETLAGQISAEGDAVTDLTRERVTEAAARVGEGLELLRLWGARASASLRVPGARLFAHGADLYLNFGDGQLAPYLATYGCTSEFPERADIARAAIARAQSEIASRGFTELAGEAGVRAVAQLADLRAVEARIANTTRFDA